MSMFGWEISLFDLREDGSDKMEGEDSRQSRFEPALLGEALEAFLFTTDL